MQYAQFFNYRIGQGSIRVFPGAHPGQMLSSGQLFKRHAPLLASPDPRRIDLRRSILNAHHDYQVRVYQQPSALDVYVIADLSASMTFEGQYSKLGFIRELIHSTALSAQSLGDNFGLIACAEQLSQGLHFPAGRHIHAALKQSEELTLRGKGRSSQGLLQAGQLLPQRRSLLFLVSDFHFDLSLLRQILHSLSLHSVVPIVLWDESEAQRLPSWGFLKLRDAESLKSRTVFMRPSLHSRILAAFAERRAQLTSCFLSFGREALFTHPEYRAERMQVYFDQFGHSL